MNQVTKKLLALQEVDERILIIKKRLAAGPDALAADEAELETHRKKHDEAARRAKEAMRAAERKNSEVDAVDEKIRNLGAKQMGARTNKEYEAFKHEIATLKADREILEEEALQQWGVGEAREEEAAREKLEVSAQEAAIEEKRREVEEECGELERDLAVLMAQRKERTAGISPSWLTIYDRILESHGCPVLAPVVDLYCQGCQMNVSIHDVTRAWKGAEVVRCRSCSRILYAETL